MEEVLKYLSLYALSTVKFIFGPALGYSYGFGIPETVILNAAGMVTPAYLVRLFGDKVRNFYKKLFMMKERRPKRFTKKNRTFVKVWKRWGLPGIAFLIPLILMPIPGALMANALAADTRGFIKWLWIFGAMWSLIVTSLLHFAGDLVADFLL